MNEYVDFCSLRGEVFIAIEVKEDKVFFTTKSGKVFKMFHEQDCCECVYLADVIGDWGDLLNSQILLAAEENSQFGTEDGSETWTFYKLATRKGYVDMRWIGESNGYYSESVGLMRIK